MNSSVGHDIDDISNSVGLKVRAERNHTLLLEVAREGCSTVSVSEVSVALRHYFSLLSTGCAHTIASTSAETSGVTHLVGGRWC